MSTPAAHESKGMPVLVQEDKVVEAYGALKAPKLVSQVAQESNQKLRLNALRVLCEELRNPYSAGETVRAGVCPILTELTTKPEVSKRCSSIVSRK